VEIDNVSIAAHSAARVSALVFRDKSAAAPRHRPCCESGRPRRAVMMTNATSDHSSATTRALRTVVVVSKDADQRVLDTVADVDDFDVVVVEPMAGAYSKIKSIAPTLIVLCVSMDDPDGFQMLSMLHLDRDTSRIPVVTSVLVN
jgi:PleD family two-component response regulator